MASPNRMNESISRNLDYSNRIILAPMVRVGALPFRLLSLDYGADLVYCEEIIDHKLLRSERKVNPVLNTVDFIDGTDGTVVFRTCDKEKNKVILQLGTSNAERALKAAKLVENDVAGIDVNMGCPKEFSIKGGMGASLLSNPDKACNIVKTLADNLKIPVTCKIRVLNTVEETVKFCQRLSSCGIKAIAIHGRMRHERIQHPNRNDFIRSVSKVLSIPVIANGGSKDIDRYEEIEMFRKDTNCSSVMIARSAEWNCSIFRPEGKLPLDEVIISYLKYSIDYDNAPANTKYCIQNMLRDLQSTPQGKKFLEMQTLEQISSVWNLDGYCKQKELEHRQKGIIDRWQIEPSGETKRQKIVVDDNGDIKEMKCAFIRNLYPTESDLPKTRLCSHARKNGLGEPRYQTVQTDKLFKSIVTLNKKKYSSSFWEKNKRWAEQTAALVCLCQLGVVDRETLRTNGSIR